jgi:hypothetical protein
VLARWVKLGIPWPKAEVLKPPAEGGFTITERQQKFWVDARGGLRPPFFGGLKT